MSNFENPGKINKFAKKAREIIGGRPIREKLASRETINIGGKELKKGDCFYYLRKDAKPVKYEILHWEDDGVIIRQFGAEKMKFKERIMGKADEAKISWDELERFSPDLPDIEEE